MADLFKDLDPVFNSNYIKKMYVKLLGFKKKEVWIIKINTETYISISINFVVI